MKKIICVFIVSFMLAFSCKSVSKKDENKAESKPAVEAKKDAETQQDIRQKEIAVVKESSDDEVIAEFDGVAITKKDKEIAKSEIEEVVEKLNKITYQKNYSYWLKFLSLEYRKHFSNKSVLSEVSQALPGVAKGIQLRNLEDYFRYVFVPSRQQGRVDDIAYISATKVRVIKKEKDKSLIFYNLEKIKGNWLLVP